MSNEKHDCREYDPARCEECYQQVLTERDAARAALREVLDVAGSLPSEKVARWRDAAGLEPPPTVEKAAEETPAAPPPSSSAIKPMAEQVAYANLLSFGAWFGIAAMTVTYIIYLTGMVQPHVEIDLIIRSWGMGVHDYLAITQSPHGWGWVAFLGKGDFMNYLGLAFLALLTIVCYFLLISGYFKRKDWPYLIISVLEVVVLSVAASGILGTGGH